MFKPTASLAGSIRRLALTTKNGPKDFYKGNRTGSMGRHTSRGGYKIDYAKVRTYVAPLNIDACQLTPFVAKRVKKERWSHEDVAEDVKLTKRFEGPGSGKLYLHKWKILNGQY